nr:hypothetical protein [Tanacetum cinerariifolium]
RKFNFLKYIFDSMVRNVDSPSKFLMYPHFLQVVINNQVDDLTSHNTKYTSPALTQKVFANIQRVRKGFSGVETPLFASMLVQPQPQAAEEKDDVEVPTAPNPPSPTTAPSPPPRDPTLHPIPHLQLHHHRNNQLLPLNLLSKEEGKEVGKEKDIKAFRVEEGRIDQDVSAATKDVNAAEPTVFDDKEVTMTMAQTLIKMKAEKRKAP